MHVAKLIRASCFGRPSIGVRFMLRAGGLRGFFVYSPRGEAYGMFDASLTALVKDYHG